jgi:ribulose-phosphate 3-epimerase
MTVNPGWGGQAFLHSQLSKIRDLKSVIDTKQLNIPIAVDGGVDIKTAPLVAEAGATILVAGSSIYNGKATVEANIAALRQSVE